jgi:transcriptional regulator with XRE-family HTH domain
MSVFSDNAKALHQKMSPFFKELRNSVGCTMRSISNTLGTAHSFVGKIEKDRRVDIAEFVLYCEAMEKDPRKMFDAMLKSVDK